MARTGTPAGFSDTSLFPFMGVKFEFDSGDAAFWTGYQDLDINGEEFIGAGTLLSFSGVDESPEISAKGVTIGLSGLDTSIISIALQENYQNRPVTVYIGTLNANTEVEHVYTLFRGRIDGMDIEEAGETCTITIRAENRLIDLERARARRYTNEDQQALYPGDTGFSYVSDLQDKQIDWGKS